MSISIRVDFVSDVVCPWCAIGLSSLEEAIRRVQGEVEVEVNFRPFELNENMPDEGENAVQHIIEKYGSSTEEIARNQASLRARGEAVGFHFDLEKRTHFYNTFDAHRLLYWAEIKGQQRQLKHALLKAYFTDGRNVSDPETLVEIAKAVGLPETEASQVVNSDQFGEHVRELEMFYRGQGINGVPTVIFNNKLLLTGSQSPDTYERALRNIAMEQAAIAKFAP
ncbi:DsbA family oxidoreductase [Pseudomonas sp. TH39(2020)]|uniref:DsbA family oxidoreductase n=1 Tax=Pseudomonas sp. TH39(2020) TaxID=2796349 RepID=UPI001913BD4D|nr:DsbA family oxidoreductase [Pseudomonas sp. TH39(2020)]MBK5395914.1 DsbA family oxidoreductase [Pseudomonas sp. TH39(2020)]